MRYITFHNGNINPLVIEYQKKVFDYFKIPIEQIETPLSHGEAIDNFLNTEKWSEIMIFDIDCIPLTKNLSYDLTGITGIAQKASHIPNSEIYAGPAWVVFDKQTYLELDKPSFVPTRRGDCGSELTYKANEKRIKVRLIYPSHVENKQWHLKNNIWFGYGTTYDDMIYHAFESNANHHSTENFINKCKSVIGES